MSISSHAIRYASALDALERARSFAKELHAEPNKPPGFEVSVVWRWGSSCVGYKDLQKEISRLVENQLPELIKTAVENLHHDAANAGQQLTSAMHLGTKGYMRAGEVS